MVLLYNRILIDNNNISNKIDNNNPTKAELDIIRLTFSEFWQLCQDVSIIWEFLNTIEAITNILITGKIQYYEEEKDIEADIKDKDDKEELELIDDVDDSDVHAITTGVLKVGLTSGNVDYVALTTVYNRARNALWNFTVKDLVDDNWLTTLPYITSEDTVFTLLENMVCLSKRYFPIFDKEPMATYGDTPLSPSANKNNLSKVIIHKPKGKFELFCLVDIYSILKLFAQHAPYMFKVTEQEEEQDQSGETQLRKIRGFDRNRTMNKGSSLQVDSMWQEFGNVVASSTIRKVVDTHQPPIDSKHRIILTENYIYDLIFMIAQGHRSIPVATSKAFPSKVTYVISDNDVAEFMYKNANELLGKLIGLQIQKTKLVKRAATISCNTALGNAVCSMANLGIDVAAIIDSKGKICGRFSSDFIAQLWISWYQQHIHDDTISFDDIVSSFKNKTLKVYDSKDTSTKFIILSKFLTPLNDCDGIINLKYFDEVMNQQIAIEEDEIESSSTSLSSESDYDDDDSKSVLKNIEAENKNKTSKPTKKGSSKRSGRSFSPNKNSSNKSSKKNRSKSPLKKRNAKRSKSPEKSKKRSAPILPSREKSEDAASRSNESMANQTDSALSPQSTQTSAPLRPSQIASGRTFTKRVARLSSRNNLKQMMDEQKLINIEKQKIEAEARRIKVLKARIALAKERVRWFKDMGMVKMTDSICHVLEAMTITKSTKVFVGTITGELQGMITLTDICQLLIKQENKLKSIQSERAVIQETINLT